MNHRDIPSIAQIKKALSAKHIVCGLFIASLGVGLTGCAKKDKKAGQALVSVNGDEITILQLNEELQRAGVQAAQKEVASKQLLESLIDRQLLQAEAARDKIDRDPKVMQAIERAKAQIVAQAYLQKRVANLSKPTKAEVEDYYKQHPELFSKRKRFDMNELVIASKDFSDALKVEMDAAKSLDQVGSWLDTHAVQYARTQLSRSTSDLPPEMAAKLQTLAPNQLFIIKEGERSLLLSVAAVKESPITEIAAMPQIEQYLFNKKNKEAAEAEVKRLRTAAKIEYLNKPADTVADKAASASASASAVVAAPVTAPVAVPAPEAAPEKPATSESMQRGISGLK